jgi:hypothetical protein
VTFKAPELRLLLQNVVVINIARIALDHQKIIKSLQEIAVFVDCVEGSPSTTYRNLSLPRPSEHDGRSSWLGTQRPLIQYERSKSSTADGSDPADTSITLPHEVIVLNDLIFPK